MFRLRLPSGVIVQIAFRHQRVLKYQAKLMPSGQVLEQSTPFVTRQAPSSEASFTTVMIRVEEHNVECDALAQLNPKEQFCYWKGREYALKAVLQNYNLEHLLTGEDRMALFQIFAAKAFPKVPVAGYVFVPFATNQSPQGKLFDESFVDSRGHRGQIRPTLTWERKVKYRLSDLRLEMPKEDSSEPQLGDPGHKPSEPIETL